MKQIGNRARTERKELLEDTYGKEKLQNVRAFVYFGFSYVILKGKTVEVTGWPSLASRPPLALL